MNSNTAAELVLNACYECKECPASIFEIVDSVMDISMNTGNRVYFYNGVVMTLDSIEMNVEFILDELGIEYIDYDGSVKNDAQQILLEGWN
ncbi:MAG: hypothetical protein RR420_01430 [Anaerovoracaceae bacterium]